MRYSFTARSYQHRYPESSGSVASGFDVPDTGSGQKRVLCLAEPFREPPQSREPVVTDGNQNGSSEEQKKFAVSEPGQCWVSDITYVPTREGWLYLAVTLDLFHRKVVGWAMGRWITRQLVIDSLNMAVKGGCLKSGLIHHSDRGVQYASAEFQGLLKAQAIQRSMSRKGDYWDNAVAESFFHTIKVELIYGNLYDTRQKVKAAIFEYIEVFYNRQRRHLYLGYLSPADFEKKFAA